MMATRLSAKLSARFQWTEQLVRDIQRYEKIFAAIEACTLLNAEDFRTWVKSAATYALAGQEPPCWVCGQPIHSGLCNEPAAELKSKAKVN